VSPRAALVLVAALGAALLATLAWILFWYDPEPADIDWRVTAYEVGEAERIRVTFEVDKEPAREARCQVAAFDAGGGSAGRLGDIVVPASTERVTRLTVVVPTEEKAVSAQVAQCVLVG
jgi:hypothetical protein